MTEQLWSNKDIINRALEHAGNGMQPHMAWERTAREMRDDMQQRIAELERMVSLEITQATRIGELEAENANLRALLPGPEVREAMRYCLQATRIVIGRNSGYPELMEQWLDRVSVAQRIDELQAAGELDSIEGEARE